MKIYIEKLCEFYSKISKTKFVAIRHSDVYGPYDKFGRTDAHVFPTLVTKVVKAEPGTDIVLWGDGKQEKDFLYVNDLVDFIIRVISEKEPTDTHPFSEDHPFEAFNVGGGTLYSIERLLELILQSVGKKLTVLYDTSKPSICSGRLLDNYKALFYYGWKPETTLEKGLELTLKWYAEKIKGRVYTA